MTDPTQISAALAELASLLHLSSCERWAEIMERLLSEMRADPVPMPARIRAIYGGMGSFGDLVLYRDGQPLSDENNELDRLRRWLYDLCRN